MITRHAFDPATGAPLSEDKTYPDNYRFGVRSPVYHPDSRWTQYRDQALTNGELQSSTGGLLGYFRRVHRSARPPDPSLDSAAALALHRIDSDEHNHIDTFVWYALAERLARKGHWVSWMIDFATPRCPHCHSELKFDRGAHPIGKCASSAEHGMVHDDILDRVVEIYNTAFDAGIDEPILIR